MFWGLIMEPGKKYSQTVTQSFHISQACLDLDTAQYDPVQVLLSTENKNFLLCTLQRGKQVQAPLDYNFQTGNKISFRVKGPGHVHLTGYSVTDNDFDLMEKEEDDDEEVPELVLPKNKKRKASEVNQKEYKVIKKSLTAMLLNEVNQAAAILSASLNRGESDTDNEDENQEVRPEMKKSPKTPQQNGVVEKFEKTPKGDKTPKKQENKSPNKQQEKTPEQNKTPGGGDKSSKQGGTPKKVVAEGGVIVEDLRGGFGPPAKELDYVFIYYQGRLKFNNEMFESGACNNFRLGCEKIMKGWNVGIKGMQRGGKRRITCPPNMAYGELGVPGVIPPNSTLVFEVELLDLEYW